MSEPTDTETPSPEPPAETEAESASDANDKPMAVVEARRPDRDIEVGSRIDALELLRKFERSRPPSGLEGLDAVERDRQADIEEEAPTTELDEMMRFPHRDRDAFAEQQSLHDRATGTAEFLLDSTHAQAELEEEPPPASLDAVMDFPRFERPEINEQQDLRDRLTATSEFSLDSTHAQAELEEEPPPASLDAVMDFPKFERPEINEQQSLRDRLTATSEFIDDNERPPRRLEDTPPTAQLEALMHFTSRSQLHETSKKTAPSTSQHLQSSAAQQRRYDLLKEQEQKLEASSMAEPFQSHGRIKHTGGKRRRKGGDSMAQLLRQEGPRLTLPPRRLTNQHIPDPDGTTPIPPELITVDGSLTADQGCKGCKPVHVRDVVHERLEFRYNRFVRLQVHHPVYICPNEADPEEFVAAQPVYWCQEAPIGNGLLAMAATALYFDRLSIARLVTLLDQLGAPIDGEVILRELGRTSTMLEPILDVMRAEARTEEAALSALVTDKRRDLPGAISVHTGEGHVVFGFARGEARATDANRQHGPAALRRWKQQGSARRWGQLRQRLFLALVTNPNRARRGLHIIQKLSPVPPTSPSELAELKQWLDGQAKTFERPQTRFEHVVTAGLDMWPLLLEEESAFRAQISDTWVVESSDGDVNSALRWLSLIESCILQNIQPWTYLYQVLQAILTQPSLNPVEWTPRAVAARS